MESTAEALELAGPDCVVTETVDRANRSFARTTYTLCVAAWNVGSYHYYIIFGQGIFGSGLAGRLCNGTTHSPALVPCVLFCVSTLVQEALARALPRPDKPYL